MKESLYEGFCGIYFQVFAYICKQKSKIMNKLFTIIIALVCLINNSFAQTFNANFAALNFFATSKVHKVGTNGTGVGNVTLYTNVITIGSQQIDCIIRTVSLTNATFTLPGSPGAGTIPFDYSSATGTGMSANDDKFFSPTFDFTAAGGSCTFHFEFILGGSYNNTTNTGTIVNLQNVYLNTYDLDGNGGASSNQFNEFNNFAATTVSTGTTVTATYNATTLLTRFRSNVSTNSSVVTADATRIKIQYNNISEFDIVVGASGAGAAYYFLDFSTGVTWAGATTSATAPQIDLNTASAGFNHQTISCGTAANITSGGANMVVSSNSSSEVRITFASAQIVDGINERLVPIGATVPATAPIALNFTGTSTQTFTLGSTSYDAQKSVSGNVRTIRFIRNGGGNFTTTQLEALFDALQYQNIASSPTLGNRTFFLNTVEGAFGSNIVQHTVDVQCALPVSWLGFDALQNNNNVMLNWSTDSEQNALHYVAQHSINGANWSDIGTVVAVGNSNQVNKYQMLHKTPQSGANFYRLKQVDVDGKKSYSKIVNIRFKATEGTLVVLENPVLNGELKIKLDQTSDIRLLDVTGRVLYTQRVAAGNHRLSLPALSKGLYYLASDASTMQQLIIK